MQQCSSHTACCNILLRYLHPRVFDPLDLAIIDRVYDAAWAQLEAREPFRDKERDGERQDVLRKLIMDDTGTTTIEFDALYDKVLADVPQSLPAFTTFKRL
jgi:hypothetical protein